MKFPINEKAALIREIAEDAHPEFFAWGYRCCRGKLVFPYTNDIFNYNTADRSHIINVLINSYGETLKPSEIERELWPALVAKFAADDDAQVTAYVAQEKGVVHGE